MSTFPQWCLLCASQAWDNSCGHFPGVPVPGADWSRANWAEIPEAPGYFVSRFGEVWSSRSGRTLSPAAHPSGHWYVSIRFAGKRLNYQVHRLVAELFIGPAPSADHEVCHNDGDASNNNVTNLRWDTRSANVQDQVRHGTHVQARKTHCPRSHAYDEANTYVSKQGKRECRACHREAQARRRAARRAA